MSNTSNLEREQALAHFGVPGMKWGVRRSNSSDGTNSNPKKPPKPTTAEIKTARFNQAQRLRKTEEAHAELLVARGRKQTEKAEKEFLRRVSDLNNNPDFRTSQRMTTGEKVTTGILLGVLGVSLAGPAIALARS